MKLNTSTTKHLFNLFQILWTLCTDADAQNAIFDLGMCYLIYGFSIKHINIMLYVHTYILMLTKLVYNVLFILEHTILLFFFIKFVTD